MTTIYLSLSAQVAKSTFFMKYPVGETELFLGLYPPWPDLTQKKLTLNSSIVGYFTLFD